MLTTNSCSYFYLYRNKVNHSAFSVWSTVYEYYHVYANLIDHLPLTEKRVRILFANLSFGVNSVLVHRLLNHPMEVPVVHHLYQSLQEILFQHHRTLMAPHKVLL